MIDYLDMPTPYITGVPRDIYVKYIQPKENQFLYNDYTIIFDIDNRKFIYEPQTTYLPISLADSVSKTILSIVSTGKKLNSNDDVFL